MLLPSPPESIIASMSQGVFFRPVCFRDVHKSIQSAHDVTTHRVDPKATTEYRGYMPLTLVLSHASAGQPPPGFRIRMYSGCWSTP